MKKNISFSIIFCLLILSLTGCSDQNNNTFNGNTTTNKKISANVSIENLTNQDDNIINEIRIGANEANLMNETELATFSTKLGGKDTPRSRNIAITTSTLNETIIKNGQTFSFCDIIRKTYCG